MVKQNVRKNAKRRYRQSYRAGIANRLWERMYELGYQCSWRNKDELNSKKNEIKEWVNSQYELTTRRPKKLYENHSAWDRGMRDGDGINLNRQMTGSGTRRIEGGCR